MFKVYRGVVKTSDTEGATVSTVGVTADRRCPLSVVLKRRQKNTAALQALNPNYTVK